MDRTRTVACVVVVVALGALSGCTKSLDGSDLEKGVAAQVARTAGARPSAMSCPDLEARKGATVTCSMTLAEQEYDVKVTVTRVRTGDRVDYAIDPQPAKN